MPQICETAKIHSYDIKATGPRCIDIFVSSGRIKLEFITSRCKSEAGWEGGGLTPARYTTFNGFIMRPVLMMYLILGIYSWTPQTCNMTMRFHIRTNLINFVSLCNFPYTAGQMKSLRKRLKREYGLHVFYPSDGGPTADHQLKIWGPKVTS